MYFLSGTRNWTQDLALPRQVLCHGATYSTHITRYMHEKLIKQYRHKPFFSMNSDKLQYNYLNYFVYMYEYIFFSFPFLFFLLNFPRICSDFTFFIPQCMTLVFFFLLFDKIGLEFINFIYSKKQLCINSWYCFLGLHCISLCPDLYNLLPFMGFGFVLLSFPWSLRCNIRLLICSCCLFPIWRIHHYKFLS